MRTGRAWNQAPDGSSSPLSEQEVLAIAKKAVTQRQHWPENKLGADHLVHGVYYEIRRADDGGWLVIARRGVVAKECGDFVYDPVKPAIVFVDKRGKITRYFRQHVDEEIGPNWQ